MEAIAVLITTFLNENAAINAVLAGQVYWEIAEEEGSQMPFCNFSIEEAPGKTKDLDAEYYASLRVFDSSLTKVARVGDVIKEQVALQRGWVFESGQCQYVLDGGKCQYAYRELKYKIR